MSTFSEEEMEFRKINVEKPTDQTLLMDSKLRSQITNQLIDYGTLLRSLDDKKTVEINELIFQLINLPMRQYSCETCSTDHVKDRLDYENLLNQSILQINKLKAQVVLSLNRFIDEATLVLQIKNVSKILTEKTFTSDFYLIRNVRWRLSVKVTPTGSSRKLTFNLVCNQYDLTGCSIGANLEVNLVTSKSQNHFIGSQFFDFNYSTYSRTLDKTFTLETANLSNFLIDDLLTIEAKVKADPLVSI